MTDNNSVVRIALVGAGAIGQRHMEFIDSCDCTQLVAIVDSADAGKAVATKARVPFFTDLSAMLKEIAPGGVIVATPNTQHVPVGITCAEHGAHLLVEKPIAESLAAANELLDCAAQNDVRVLVGHHRRHNPIIRRAREIVQAGELGDVTSVSAHFLVCKPDHYYEVEWRRRAGGGPILINLIHDIDCLRYIVGEIESVQAMASNRRRQFEIEDTVSVSLRFTNGALGTIAGSDTTPAPWSWEISAGENPDYPHASDANCYLIAGTKAALAIPSLKRWHHEPARDWFNHLEQTSDDVQPKNPLAEQMQHFADVIRGKTQPRIDGVDGTRTLAVTLAIREAAEHGGIITP